MAFVPRLTSQGIRGNRYWYSSLNTFYPNNPLPNCTCYAYGRWLEIAGGDVTKLAGLFTKSYGSRNGGNWYRASPSLQAGIANPQLGDIACWGFSDYRRNGWGHVAVVEEIHPDYIVVSASYYSGTFFNTENCPKSNGYKCRWMKPGGKYDYILHGFIRMGGASGTIVPSIDMPTEWVVRVGEGRYLNDEEELNNAIMAYVALTNADPTLTLEACCGIIGNMCGEVSLNPGCLQEGRPSAGGLVGWDPLTKWSHEASLRGIPWTDGDGQCEWVLSDQYWEYSGGVWTLHSGFWAPGKAGGMTYDEFKHSTDTPERLAELFCYAYEKAGIPHMEKRTTKARYYYEYLTANLPFMTKEKGPKVPFSVLDYPVSAYEIKLR